MPVVRSTDTPAYSECRGVCVPTDPWPYNRVTTHLLSCYPTYYTLRTPGRNSYEVFTAEPGGNFPFTALSRMVCRPRGQSWSEAFPRPIGSEFESQRDTRSR